MACGRVLDRGSGSEIAKVDQREQSADQYGTGDKDKKYRAIQKARTRLDWRFDRMSTFLVHRAKLLHGSIWITRIRRPQFHADCAWLYRPNRRRSYNYGISREPPC